MNWIQRLALWLAIRSGLLPRIDERDISAASVAVRSAEAAHKGESPEYRRHIAYTRLVELGLRPRTAALSIEIAVATKE